jgi:hypothetical protein
VPCSRALQTELRGGHSWLGIAGTIGFGGGFRGAYAPDFAAR